MDRAVLVVLGEQLQSADGPGDLNIGPAGDILGTAVAVTAAVNADLSSEGVMEA